MKPCGLIVSFNRGNRKVWKRNPTQNHLQAHCVGDGADSTDSAAAPKILPKSASPSAHLPFEKPKIAAVTAAAEADGPRTRADPTAESGLRRSVRRRTVRPALPERPDPLRRKSARPGPRGTERDVRPAAAVAARGEAEDALRRTAGRSDPPQCRERHSRTPDVNTFGVLFVERSLH